MRKKKDLPLIILKALEPYVGLKGEKFEVIEPKEHLLKIVDKDIDSDFHFTIEKYQKTTSSNTFQFLMTRSPKNVSDNGNHQIWVEISSLGDQFNAWLKLLHEYDTINTFFDDPITKSFTQEFYTEFEIVDEDADVTPLNTKQILCLDSYLDSIGNKLSELTTEINSQEIQVIQEDIVVLRDNLTKKSKKWIVSKLANIWAKMAKQGAKFIKEFLNESKKEIAKQVIKGIIDYVKANGTELLK